MTAPAKIREIETPRRILFPAVAGDVVSLLEGPADAQYVERSVVAPRCDTFSPRGFVCITHRQRLANEYQLQSHLETMGPDVEHVVASVCAWHGAEELKQ